VRNLERAIAGVERFNAQWAEWEKCESNGKFRYALWSGLLSLSLTTVMYKLHVHHIKGY